jgi:hypothetical protein
MECSTKYRILATFAVTSFSLAWMMDKSGFDGTSYLQAMSVGALVILLGLAVVAVQHNFVRERITVEDESFGYERFVGPVRVARRSYDLLEMHGLRGDLQQAFTGTLSDSEAAESRVAVPRYAIGPSLAIWSHGEPFLFGHSLDADDRASVVSALLRHDAAFRVRLGLPADKGLLDTTIWTVSRTQTLSPLYAPHRFTGWYFGRGSDYDR